MARLERITSPANSLIKDVRKTVARGGLTEEGLCVAEGFHLLEEALRSRCAIEAVLATEPALARLPQIAGARVIEVPEKLFQSLAGTETSQGVLCLVRLRAWAELDLLREPGLVLVLDGVQDPGNAGTIVRAAEAFGATGVVFGRGSARPDHPKTLRASAGSLFRFPFIEAEQWRPARLKMFAAVPFSPAAKVAEKADLRQPCAIVIGSEGQGVGAWYRDLEPIAIATSGVESLNAGVAASILLYEAHRQRSGGRK